jgi:signal transduction histidine kinase
VTAGPEGRAERVTAEQLVKVAFLVRLSSLAVALAGMVNTDHQLWEYALLLALACVSYLGLASAPTRDLLVRHPILAMSDIALVIWVVLQLGVQNPLVLATVSTALLIGVLYRFPFALVPAGLLLTAVVVAALLEEQSGAAAGAGYLGRVGLPAVLAVLTYLGHAVRVIQENERAALAALAAERVAATADRERTRLAREMHDGVAKSLQGLALTATGLSAWVDRDTDRAKAEARILAEGAGRAVQETRALLSQLRLDHLGEDLSEVIERMVADWRARTGRKVDLHLAPVPPLNPDARYELLAALREALENVSRHAGDAAVELRLGPHGNGLRLEVIDDGPGFDLDILPAREAAGHFGVRGMTERLATAGGRVELSSTPGRGTRVSLLLELLEPEPS